MFSDGVHPEPCSPKVRVVWGQNVGGTSCRFIVIGNELSGPVLRGRIDEVPVEVPLTTCSHWEHYPETLYRVDVELLHLQP